MGCDSITLPICKIPLSSISVVPVGISLVLSGVGSNGATEVAEKDAEEDAEDAEVEGPSAIGINSNESLNSLLSSILIEPLG